MTRDFFDEPIRRPGIKNLDNYEIDFPEHNLDEYICYSNQGKEEVKPDFPESWQAAADDYELSEDVI